MLQKAQRGGQAGGVRFGGGAFGLEDEPCSSHTTVSVLAYQKTMVLQAIMPPNPARGQAGTLWKTRGGDAFTPLWAPQGLCTDVPEEQGPPPKSWFLWPELCRQAE
jgi:hypothetical protein